MGGHQLEFAFSRGSQGIILDLAVIAPGVARGGAKVGAKVLKGLLCAIDRFAGRAGECFASEERLASRLGCSVRTVIRALEVLEGRELIIRRRKLGADRVTRNHYRIIWTRLALAVPVELRPAPENLPAPVAGGGPGGSGFSVEQSDTGVTLVGGDQSDTPTDQSDTPTDQSDTSVTPKEPIGEGIKESSSSSSSGGVEEEEESGDGEKAWGLAATLASMVLADWSGAVLAARSHGLAPAEVKAIVMAWIERRRPDWRPGLLHATLLRAAAGTEVEVTIAGWPEPNAEFKRLEKARRMAKEEASRNQRLARERAEGEEREARFQAHAAALEAEFGPGLDALAGEERLAFVESLGLFLCRQVGRKWPPAGELRVAVLERFAARCGAGQAR